MNQIDKKKLVFEVQILHGIICLYDLVVCNKDALIVLRGANDNTILVNQTADGGGVLGCAIKNHKRLVIINHQIFPGIPDGFIGRAS